MSSFATHPLPTPLPPASVALTADFTAAAAPSSFVLTVTPPAVSADVSPGAVWRFARQLLSGLPSGRGLNIAYEAVDRHVVAGRGDVTAVRWVRPDDTVSAISYRALASASSQAAAAFVHLGLRRGDRVGLLLPPRPEAFAAALGALKAGLVVCPLAATWPRELYGQLLARAAVRTLVTTPLLYENRVLAGPGAMAVLDNVITVGGNDRFASAVPTPSGGETLPWPVFVAGQPRAFTIPATEVHDPALLLFTRGTTGVPKGTLHVHEAVVAHQLSAALALGLEEDDVYWCTAEPGTAQAAVYGILAPLISAATIVVAPDAAGHAGDGAQHAWHTLSEQGVTVWYTEPRLVRRLMRTGSPTLDVSRLRHVATTGEPLDANAVVWGERALGTPVRDTWWQAETGAILIAGCPGSPVRPGSLGHTLPGVTTALLACGDDGRVRMLRGRVVEVTEPDAVGELAIRAPWPSMFRNYAGQPERYARQFIDGWYLTGDLMRIDAEGGIWFAGRRGEPVRR